MGIRSLCYARTVARCAMVAVFALWTAHSVAAAMRNIACNDNRQPAGVRRDGVLSIRLEIGEGTWHPEAENGPALDVYAFGEQGGSLQNPGPLIRVPQGTTIHATVHNALAVKATMHGLHERPGDPKQELVLPPGGTAEVQFKTGPAGTYHYWASAPRPGQTEENTDIDSQLTGALVVDPPSAERDDRIFVISLWGGLPRGGGPQFPSEIAAVNGKSWPYTEHFNFKVGEEVRWRWINGSMAAHAMHLHGFYYRLNAVSDGERSQEYSPEKRPLVSTHHVEGLETFDMSFVPERAGRWLFHCHMLVHMSPGKQAAGMVPAAAKEHEHDPTRSGGMAGLVLGITVEGGTPTKAFVARRKLQLMIVENPAKRPRYAVEVRDPAQPDMAREKRLIGAPLVLTQGEPVEIAVVNRLKQPTAIHWHGIEIESYYDGVPGWTGTAAQTTPAVMPGASFVARITPPRAGTFIYHTHWHDREQLENGIYGPMIVLPAGEKFDAVHDKVFLFSMGTFEPFGEMLLINGTPQPQPLRLQAGVKYRFRLINIAPDNVNMQASFRQAGTPVEWKAIAKDGAD